MVFFQKIGQQLNYIYYLRETKPLNHDNQAGMRQEADEYMG